MDNRNQANPQSMLRPKDGWLGNRPARVPLLSDYDWSRFEHMTGQLGPPERRAMREIAEQGDLLMVDGQIWLVAPVSQEALDAIAAFEAVNEDIGPDDEDGDHCDTEIDDPVEDDSSREEDRSDFELEEAGFCNPMTGATPHPTVEQQLRARSPAEARPPTHPTLGVYRSFT